MKRALVVVVAAVACGGSPAVPVVQPALPPEPPITVDARSVAPAVAPGDQPLPLWSAITTGTLANGLTYYVLPAHQPAHRAVMWLAVNAGSILEDDDQRGLAHFDEHMAFNGTKRFPHQALVDYLQSIGVAFGADLNAFTEFDDTVYQLEVPTDKPELVGKGLDILRDWAGDVTYDPDEVKSERGVVREEWRLGRGADQRLGDKHTKVMFKGSRYAERAPIGDVHIIDSAPRDTLYRFYKDWYRPDLMAVIVVGEVDPAQIKAEISQRFADLVNPPNERARQPAGVPVADGTRVTIETDREMTETEVSVVNVVGSRGRASRTDDRRLLVEELYKTLLAERFDIVSHQPQTAFFTAEAGVEALTREVDAFEIDANAKSGQAEAALREVLIEVARAERHGFSDGELAHARDVLLRGYESHEAAEATRDSSDYASEISRYFFHHELMVGAADERKLALEILPTITVAELNELVKSYGGAQNRVIEISAPDGEKLPSRERVLALVDEVAHLDVPAWEDKPVASQLIAQAPKPGKIVKEQTLAPLATTLWTLSNGVHVYVKPTDFAADEIELGAYSPGGLATASDRDFDSARFAAEIVPLGGAGALDESDIARLLAAKSASVSVDISETTESVRGKSSVKDLETMFQLVYLRMSAPRLDPGRFAVWKQSSRQELANDMRDPSFVFFRDWSTALWRANKRKLLPEAADLDKISLDKAFAFYRSRFGDATDFTFVISGATDLARLRPVVETYLASLPAKGRSERETDLGIRKIRGALAKQWTTGQAPRAQVRLEFHADDAWARDRDRDLAILSAVLSNRLREVLREDLGGVYDVEADGTWTRVPHAERSFVIEFSCDPARVDQLIDATLGEIRAIAANGIDAAHLEQVKQTYLRGRETEQRTNDYWLDWFERVARYKDDPTLVLDPSALLARMTSDHVRDAAKQYLDRKDLFKAVLLPDTAPAGTQPQSP